MTDEPSRENSNDARAALASVETLSHATARRAVLPFWTRVSAAVLIGAMVAVQAAPHALLITALLGALGGVLLWRWRRAAGVTPRPVISRRSQLLTWLAILVPSFLIGIARGFREADGLGWVPLVLAVVAAAAVFVSLTNLVHGYARREGLDVPKPEVSS
jgi:uncharacterized membrane-anchored protein